MKGFVFEMTSGMIYGIFLFAFALGITAAICIHTNKLTRWERNAINSFNFEELGQ